MKSTVLGFTLIELIAVIVILGVLAATAVPRFVDLSDAAQEAGVGSIAGALSSASSLNHANNLAVDAGLTTSVSPIVMLSCETAVNLLDGGLDKQYTIQPGTGVALSSGGVAAEGGASECIVAYDANHNGTYDTGDVPSASFTAYGVE